MLERLSAAPRAVTASSPPVLEPSDDRPGVRAGASAVDGVPRPASAARSGASASPGEAAVVVRGREAFEFVRSHLLVVVTAAVVAVGATGWWVWSTRTAPVPVEAEPASGGPGAAPVAAPSVTGESRAAGRPGGGSNASGPTTAAGAPLRVHVLGAVRRPGVVELAPGARVADAVGAAGGLTAAANPAELNLAQPLGDGQQIVIGTRAKPVGEIRQGAVGPGPAVPGGASRPSGAPGGGAPGAGATGAGCVDVNTASASALEELPGVGPKTAEKIVARRAEKGPFTRPEELQEVPGIGPKTFAELETGVCR